MKVPVSTLRAGLVFSKPVYIDDDNFLVPAGIEIREKDIEQLRSWHIETVETDGAIMSMSPGVVPESGEAVAEQDVGQADGGGSAEQDAAEQAEEAALMGRILPEDQKIDLIFWNYLDIIKEIDEFFACIASGAIPDARVVTILTEDLIQTIRENRITTVGFILGSETPNRGLAKNSINTAILSALIAEEFGYSEQNLRQLITGALLHDVGMLRLPWEILDKRGQFSPEETWQMQAHPFYSYDVVYKELEFPEDVGCIVIQHHEYWNGEGYPRHFRRQDIAMGARIVSAADAFEAMVSEKTYRNSMIGYQAMKNILSDNSRRFDPDVLKTFVRIMGIYPIGSVIRLNTGAVARVTDVRKEAPLRPKIRILIDERGTAIQSQEGNVIDLLREKNLFITRALNHRHYAKRA
ncbi:MAG: HD-GYP domain-containing protein [Treponema sp.]|jgi:HD-GYP domain-containing protein (c-di-GMP phosphodiesterase class II)|nr:HD-GYP domain-containing protein [Treponema sp.]